MYMCVSVFLRAINPVIPESPDSDCSAVLALSIFCLHNL